MHFGPLWVGSRSSDRNEWKSQSTFPNHLEYEINIAQKICNVRPQWHLRILSDAI